MELSAIKSAMRARHKLPDAADVRVLMLSAEMKGVEDSDPYKFTARITTSSIDRQGEVVVPQGGDVGEFMQSGIISWNHDYSSPVGFPNKSRNILRGEGFIECGGIFMRKPADWGSSQFFPDFARTFVGQAMAAGINPGVSIGFMPIESRNATKADIAKYGAGVGAVHSKWKLLEFSIAPVQANQDAYVTAVGKGLMAREVAEGAGLVIPAAPARPAAISIATPRIVEHHRCIVPSAPPPPDIAMLTRDAIFKAFGRVYA